ncbi:MAG: Hsp20/alpha crystallin family protein [Caulobacteraceae bacterium]|nr:Hsp20/alpha crystallin family protein [Caulobacteraceae bacterium]
MANDSQEWMWTQALGMLARAERLREQMFNPRSAPSSACWQPPADVLETEREVLVLAALPGVDADKAEVAIEGPSLVISGQRTLPPELRMAVIHRMELPQGRFERRIPLPPGRYETVRRASVNGCLVVTLTKGGHR